MRIGTHLIASGDVSAEQLRADAAAALELGTDSLWTNPQPGGWDPLTVLPALPGGSEVGTAVVPTYPHHPVMLATQALTVQELTGGRLTLGVGPGHELVTTGWLGLPYVAPARHTREYLEVLHPLLRGEHVRFSGEFFTVDTQITVRAKPPSVLLAAMGPRMLEVARDLADGTIAAWTRPETVESHFVPRLGDGARVLVMAMVSVTSDPDAVRERVARKFGMAGELPAYRAMLDRGGLSGPADSLLVGDESVVLRGIRQYRDAGTTDLILSVPESPEERNRALEVIKSGI
ncbi:TIGR03564 family F420-dependent LLM class oxidoreductase [Amycolatopsis sacchari]|uniref:F420-dependent oxidoreductase, MSMEG_4879 family n=1 Tax=Amycolatopsis sacchari TaxID=115433 RepID=A0A1I3R059_9PSEU|nr:TIGR03564 family F420-dependent LLM class oxidoreductase [Amycolatopsis sacchari]SFJ39410.1 F420-dependent oxidoreductase, MSMEG_4879 family [Amycolatopsis sacchari]